VSDAGTYLVKFSLKANPSVSDPAELVVFVYQNPQNLSLEEFYDGQQHPDLFKDAVGGYKPFTAGGATGYWFDTVLGLENYTVVALSTNSLVYEISDAQRHQDDGLFLQIVNSFKHAES
jgi:hypothetical protein